ncbi:MAG: hypothetical protein ACT443_05730 [Gemmatimonadota bacterium]
MARQLLSHAMSGNRPAELLPAAEAVCLRLDEHLSRSIGSAGFRALLTRAVARAQDTQPALGTVRIEGAPGRWLSGLDESVERYGTAAVAEAVVTLLAEFIALLGRFVGGTLAARLIRTAWPEALQTNNESSDLEGQHG